MCYRVNIIDISIDSNSLKSVFRYFWQKACTCIIYKHDRYAPDPSSFSQTSIQAYLLFLKSIFIDTMYRKKLYAQEFSLVFFTEEYLSVDSMFLEISI